MPGTDDRLFDRIAAFTAINAAATGLTPCGHRRFRRVNVQSATGRHRTCHAEFSASRKRFDSADAAGRGGLPRCALVCSHRRITAPCVNQGMEIGNGMGNTDDSLRLSPPVFFQGVVAGRSRRAERPGIRVHHPMRVNHQHHARRRLEDLEDGWTLPSKRHRSARWRAGRRCLVDFIGGASTT